MKAMIQKTTGIKNQQRTLLINKSDGMNGLSLRFSQGASWDKQSAQLAMLVTKQRMVNEINICERSDEAKCHIAQVDQVIIRSNNYQPEFEPSRHEMRIFDDLDGFVTEM